MVNRPLSDVQFAVLRKSVSKFAAALDDPIALRKVWMETVTEILHTAKTCSCQTGEAAACFSELPAATQDWYVSSGDLAFDSVLALIKEAQKKCLS